jgi:hypothetical protein
MNVYLSETLFSKKRYCKIFLFIQSQKYDLFATTQARQKGAFPVGFLQILTSLHKYISTRASSETAKGIQC